MPQLLKLQQQLNCILIFHNTSKIKFHSSFYSLFLFLLLHFICLRRRPLLTFNSICLVRGAACACVVCANECVFVRMCVCVCSLPVCMQSIANVEEKQQLQHTFRHTNMHTHTRTRRQLFVYEKYARNWQNVDKLITCMLCELRANVVVVAAREREPSFVWSALGESAHTKTVPREQEQCVLWGWERGLQCDVMHAPLPAWHCINIELGSWWRSVPASFCRRHRAHWLHTGQVVTQIRKYT